MTDIYRTKRTLLIGFISCIFILLVLTAKYSNGQTIDQLHITSLTLREKEGKTTTNYPLTFAHVFKKGDVMGNVSVSMNGTIIPTQFDVKRRYDDGSVRHAVISVVLPVIKAYEDVTIELIPGGTPASKGEMSKAEILSTDVQSLIELANISGSGYSGRLTADLRQAITAASELNYWLKGSIVTEILVKQKLNKSLNAAWEVRFYPGWNGIRVSNAIENVEADYRGNIKYAVNIQLGNARPMTVYSKPTFSHNHNARWRKVVWLGQEPPEVEIRYDFNYLIETGYVLNYDTSLSLPTSIIESLYKYWRSTDHDIMETSYITTYFPTTGGREEIGILPTWTVRYLYSMDNRMKEVMLNLAELASGAPIHYRESASSRSFYGHILSIDDRPTVWLGWNDFKYLAEEDRLPDPIGPTETDWFIDRAHQASFAYIPYLVTGEHYYLEELYYWAGYDLADSNYSGRDYAKGLIKDQVRGEAWAIRNIVDAAALAPDGDIEKAYLEGKVANNINAWQDATVNNPNAPPLHTWGYVSCRGEDGGRPMEVIIGCTTNPKTGKGSGSYEDIYPVRHISLPWQDDFVLLSLKHIIELGYPAQDVHRWLGEYAINRFTHPDVNPYNGAAYIYPATYIEHVDILEPYYNIQTWKQAHDSFLEQLTSFPEDDYPYSYNYIALAALSTATGYQVEQHLANGSTTYATGQQAYEWLRSHVHNIESLNEDPTWAIVPRSAD